MISWEAPLVDGGCPIFDYEVQRDEDGTGAVWTTVNPIESYPRNDPYVRDFECSIFPAGAQVGDLFRFRVLAYNIQGNVVSTETR